MVRMRDNLKDVNNSKIL